MRIAAVDIGTSAAVVAGFNNDAAVFELDDDAAAVKLAIFAAETGAKPGVDARAVTMAFACHLAAFGFDLTGCFQFPRTDDHLIDRAPRMECCRGEHHAHVLGVAQRHPPSLGVGLVDPGTHLRGIYPLRHKLRRRNNHLERNLSAAHVDAVLDREANR